ncbi:hypothetical protein EDB84DRAFT_1569944 [Lactarius hengduanensis]|nr:hypothetical protein EDB84DRAFT_1569944 [Lactarius hengduanensis]
MNNSSDGNTDFDDGANALWSLYSKEAQTHDEALFQGLLADMNGIPTFAGLFAAVLTSFLVDSLKNLQPDPAQQSVYYQQQSVAILAQISQQIASIAPQVSVSSDLPPPYPDFSPSSSDVWTNALWLVGLIFSLSAALFATLVQVWVRSYMEVFQQHDHPLKRARFRQFFFDGTRTVQTFASSATWLIRISLCLFFVGLSNAMSNINTTLQTVAINFTIQPIYIFAIATLIPVLHMQTPDKSLLWLSSFLVQMFEKLYFSSSKRLTSVGAYQESLVMEKTDWRKARDVRATRWLINRTAANADVEPLMLAIPGSFNTEWGREVWRTVSSQTHDTGPSSTSSQISLILHPPHPPEGAAVDTVSRCVRYFFETCNNRSNFENEAARHRRMRACIEAAASLVCRLDYRLDWFGEVGKVVSEIGQIEKVNSPTTTSDTSFIMRWTCLSLVDIQRKLGRSRLKALAGYAVNGLVRFQSEHGQPDETGRERVDECLKTAWERVEDLRRAFEPWAEKRTRKQVEQVLLTHEQQISDLERIKSEADEMAVVDREVSVYQDAMDDATHGLTRQLPGVSFDEPRRSESFLLSDTFNTPATIPQLIFPGQQLQALARLGLKLREVLDGQVAEGYEEVLECLKSIDKVPVALRRPNGLMRRQIWRLQDVRDGGGLGFSIELFFLSLRRLLSISSMDESNSVFYTGTFKVITSHWMEGKESPGTHHILLNIICDLIIPGRGIFSDFSYPESITTMLIDAVRDILQGYVGPDEDILEALREIESADPDKDVRDAVREIDDVEPIRMDRKELQRRALAAFPRSVAAQISLSQIP